MGILYRIIALLKITISIAKMRVGHRSASSFKFSRYARSNGVLAYFPENGPPALLPSSLTARHASPFLQGGNFPLPSYRHLLLTYALLNISFIIFIYGAYFSVKFIEAFS